MDNCNGKEILTIEQAAEFLQLPKSTLYSLAQKGEVPCRKVGRHWRFSRRELEDHVAGRPSTTALLRLIQQEQQPK